MTSTQRHKCRHETLSFGSGDYYIFCANAECDARWVCCDSGSDLPAAHLSNQGIGGQLSGQERSAVETTPVLGSTMGSSMKVHKFAWGVEYTDEQLARELISAAAQVEISMSGGLAWIVKRTGERMLELLPSSDETSSDVAALLTVQQENKRLRGALARISVGTPDLLPPYRSDGASQLRDIATKALQKPSSEEPTWRFAIGAHVRFTDPKNDHCEWVISRIRSDNNHDPCYDLYSVDDRTFTLWAFDTELREVNRNGDI